MADVLSIGVVVHQRKVIQLFQERRLPARGGDLLGLRQPCGEFDGSIGDVLSFKANRHAVLSMVDGREVEQVFLAAVGECDRKGRRRRVEAQPGER